MARSMPSTPLASTRSIAPAANTRSASSTSPQHHPPNQPQLGSIHHPQNQIGVSTLGSQSRRKESSLINQWYVPLYGCGACGVVVNALELSTNPRANLLATATTSICDPRRTRESELKLRSRLYQSPAILILIFGGLRAWASSYIRKGVRRSRREWWWLGEGEREKQIVPGGEDQECGDRRQLVEEVVAWSKLSPCGTPKIVANVADGMDCEGEQVQGDQNGREALFSMAEAVFEVVPLVFKNVEGFVLDLFHRARPQAASSTTFSRSTGRSVMKLLR